MNQKHQDEKTESLDAFLAQYEPKIEPIKPDYFGPIINGGIVGGVLGGITEAVLRQNTIQEGVITFATMALGAIAMSAVKYYTHRRDQNNLKNI